MTMTVKKDKKEVLERLQAAQLRVPDPWPAIEGRINSSHQPIAWPEAESSAVRSGSVVRRMPRLVIAANIVLVLAVALIAGIILAGRDKPSPTGTLVPAGIGTTETVFPETSELPRYPTDARWATMEFRSNALITTTSGTIDRIERFDTAAGDWVPAAPGYIYTFDAGNAGTYGYSWKFAMIDLDLHPLSPGLYRATMKVLTEENDTAECRAEFEIVASGRHPEFIQAILEDPNASPEDYAYRPDGLDWGMEKAEVFAALGLTEDDFVRDGDDYTRKEPVRYRFPDVDATVTYSFADEKLSAARYDIAPVTKDPLYAICGQLELLKDELLKPDMSLVAEFEYIDCLLTGANRNSTVGTSLYMKGVPTGLQVDLTGIRDTGVPENTSYSAQPFAWVEGVPQYAADAQTIVLTLHHPALEGAMGLSIEYERFNAAQSKWERVMPNRGKQHWLYFEGEVTESYPSDSYTYPVMIGEPLYEAPLGAGHYRAVVTIQSKDQSTYQVTNTEAILLFDLVELG